MTVERSPRGSAPGWLLTVGWALTAILIASVVPYAGVAVALVCSLAIRARWKLFIALAVALLAIALLLAPVGGSGAGSSGLVGG